MQLPEVLRNEPIAGIFRNLWDPFFYDLDRETDGQRALLPSSDIIEDENQWSLLIDLPGVKQKDVSVNLEDKWLTIKAERHAEKEVRRDHYRHLERVSGSYQRRFALPENADGEKLTAKMKDGVLHINIGKKELETTNRKQIPVQVE